VKTHQDRSASCQKARWTLLSTNLNGGTYENGNPYSKSKRLEVLRIIGRRKNEGKSTSSRKVAEEAKVGPTFVRKVVHDMQETGTIKAPLHKKQSARLGPGSLSMNELDYIDLVHLLRASPQRSLRSYKRELYKITGRLDLCRSTRIFWSNRQSKPFSHSCCPWMTDKLRRNKLRPPRLNLMLVLCCHS
jgi:hypothetical protein